jgi:very-short-patch-repair endonuclease
MKNKGFTILEINNNIINSKNEEVMLIIAKVHNSVIPIQ